MCLIFDLKSIENMQKGDKLGNFYSKLPETRGFKGTCYTTKNSCTDGGNPTKKLNFRVTSHFKGRCNKT